MQKQAAALSRTHGMADDGAQVLGLRATRISQVEVAVLLLKVERRHMASPPSARSALSQHPILARKKDLLPPNARVVSAKSDFQAIGHPEAGVSPTKPQVTLDHDSRRKPSHLQNTIQLAAFVDASPPQAPIRCAAAPSAASQSPTRPASLKS